MSSAAFKNLRSSVLALPETERAELARDLMQSLDGPTDAGAAAAWEEEILRRVERIESGSAQIIDREEFSRRIRARLSR